MDMVGGSKRIYVPARNGLPERRSKTDGGSIKGRGQDTPVLRSSLKTRACLAIVRFICLVRTLNFAPQNFKLGPRQEEDLIAFRPRPDIHPTTAAQPTACNYGPLKTQPAEAPSTSAFQPGCVACTACSGTRPSLPSASPVRA